MHLYSIASQPKPTSVEQLLWNGHLSPGCGPKAVEGEPISPARTDEHGIGVGAAPVVVVSGDVMLVSVGKLVVSVAHAPVRLAADAFIAVEVNNGLLGPSLSCNHEKHGRVDK